MARARDSKFDRFLGPLEQRIMEDLWDTGESTVGAVLDRINSHGRERLVYNTVMSTMARLFDKGFLERRRDGRAFLYRASTDRVEFLKRRATEVTDELVDDLGTAAVAGIVASMKTRPELLEELRRRMDEAI